jgi:hypothetical protein
MAGNFEAGMILEAGPFPGWKKLYETECFSREEAALWPFNREGSRPINRRPALAFDSEL